MNNKVKLQPTHKSSLTGEQILSKLQKQTTEESYLLLHGLGFSYYPELDQLMIPDLILAESLGFERPREIRRLISRHGNAIQKHGELIEYIDDNGNPGRKSTGFLLNLKQAFYVIAKSETRVADSLLDVMVTITAAFMRGDLLPSNFTTAVEIHESQRLALLRHREEKAARYDALRILNKGRKRRKKPSTSTQSSGRNRSQTPT